MHACINPVTGQGAEVVHRRIEEDEDSILCMACLIKQSQFPRCVNKTLTSLLEKKNRTLGNDLRRRSMIMIKFRKEEMRSTSDLI